MENVLVLAHDENTDLYLITIDRGARQNGPRLPIYAAKKRERAGQVIYDLQVMDSNIQFRLSELGLFACG